VNVTRARDAARRLALFGRSLLFRGSVGHLTPEAKRAFLVAQEEAEDRNHRHIGPEHLLLGLAGIDAGAARILARLGADRERVRSAVDSVIDNRHAWVVNEVRLSASCKRVIELAVEEASRLRDPRIDTEHLLLGILRERHNGASGVLLGLGVSQEMVASEVGRTRH
jgi:ATP-dependent Clp protease ATP-binding subunit ClpC